MMPLRPLRRSLNRVGSLQKPTKAGKNYLALVTCALVTLMSTGLGFLDYQPAFAAISCPSGTTLVSINSVDYCKVNYTSGATTTFTIPATGVSQIKAIITGGKGRDTPPVNAINGVATGGFGAEITVETNVSAGQVLTLTSSINGGSTATANCGSPPTAYGGGYAKLAISGGAQVVAGGGGGGGCSGSSFQTAKAGNGGNAGLPEVPGVSSAAPAAAGQSTGAGTGGGGGTLISGGTGGTVTGGGTAGGNGSALTGGIGASGGQSAGGGGAGYFGGGAGVTTGFNPPPSGGGGGSSYVSGLTVTAASFSSSTSLAGSVEVLFQYSVAISYDSQGGSAAPAGSFWPGGTTTLPAAPTKVGYGFAGWYSAATGGTRLGGASESFSPSGSSPLTIYAQWTPESYVVTFNTQGGPTVSNGTYTYGVPMTLPTLPSRSGYTNNGWFSSAQGGTALNNTYNPQTTSNFTLYSQWTPNTYVITFDTQGGSPVANGSYTFDVPVSMPPPPTKTGFVFSGWFSSAQGGTALNNSFNPQTTTPFTIYAQWTPAPVDNNPESSTLAHSGAPYLQVLILGAGLVLMGAAALVLAITRRELRSRLK
jgi:uncharacterized repeat protein (TIGR02543 family)